VTSTWKCTSQVHEIQHQSCAFKPALSSNIKHNPALSLSLFSPVNTHWQPQPQSNSIVTSPKGNVSSPVLVFTSLFSLVCGFGFLLLSHTCLSVSASGASQATCRRRCVSVTDFSRSAASSLSSKLCVCYDPWVSESRFGEFWCFECVHERCVFHCLDSWQNNQTKMLALCVSIILTVVMTIIMFHLIYVFVCTSLCIFASFYIT